LAGSYIDSSLYNPPFCLPKKKIGWTIHFLSVPFSFVLLLRIRFPLVIAFFLIFLINIWKWAEFFSAGKSGARHCCHLKHSFLIERKRKIKILFLFPLNVVFLLSGDEGRGFLIDYFLVCLFFLCIPYCFLHVLWLCNLTIFNAKETLNRWWRELYSKVHLHHHTRENRKFSPKLKNRFTFIG
jgi:hypothetical protein